MVPNLTIVCEEFYDTLNNAWVTDEFGLARGFDEFYKVWQYIQTDTDLGQIKLTNDGTDLLKEGAKSILNGDLFANLVNTIYGQFFYRRSDYGAQRTNDIIKEWITDQNHQDPFFLFVNFLEPHLEYRPPKDYAEQFLPESASFDDAMDVPQEQWHPF